MWIKETIKNRFLSKKKANKLISLLEFQLNILNDDAYEYLAYSSKLKEYIKENIAIIDKITQQNETQKLLEASQQLDDDDQKAFELQQELKRKLEYSRME